MVVTVLEAEVSPKRWNDLKKAYENLTQNPPAVAPIQSFLLQSIEDVNIWRLVGMWRSREEVEKMRAQGVPRGVKLFQDVDAEPSMEMWEIAATTMVPESMPLSQH